MQSKLKISITDYISPNATEVIRENISLANSNEVFFICKLKNKIVVEAEAVARGGKDSVPAVMQIADYGDVVIHNHPSGGLDPSEADLSIATSLASMGVGSYIVDNDVSEIYIIVNPFKEKQIIQLQSDEITSTFMPENKLAKKLPTYEYRPEQIEMAKSVIKAFNDNKIAVIEAGTGVGKSLAYLLPAIHWSLLNKERVVISTNTINLQEQLINKDIPFLSNKLGIKFRSVLIKGRGNYVCLRKADFYKTDLIALEEENSNSELKSILEWLDKTSDGSISDINPTPSNETWEKVASNQGQCLRVRCKHFEKCYFYNARRQAACSDILIANHHLLMADIALRFQTDNFNTAAVLPPFQRIIFDEAHNLEDVATSYFGESVSKLSLIRLLNKLANPKKDNKGYLNLLARQVSTDAFIDLKFAQMIYNRIQNEIIPYRKEIQDLIFQNIADIYDAIQEYLNKTLKQGEEERVRITPAIYKSILWEETIVPYIKNIIEEIHKFVEGLKSLINLFNQIPQQHRERFLPPILDIKSIYKKLLESAANFNFFISGSENSEGYCKWIEMYQGKDDFFFKFNFSPIVVGKNLKKAIYDIYKTVLMTSATLTIKKEFNFLMNRIGLDEVEPERLILQRLDSPFDYNKQVFCAVPTDIPLPGSAVYDSIIPNHILQAIVISEGRAFVLFTSYRLMNKIFEQLSPTIKKMGFNCFKQGSENRDLLLRKFREDTTSVLFATSSFWEGVDVPGRALECLILTKLPFKVPTEPILEARVEYIESQGGDSFMEFTVPLAVIKFKQGFGRLIRGKKDFGAVLIFDKRVATKNYGKLFIESLPMTNILISDSENIFSDMKDFFDERILE